MSMTKVSLTLLDFGERLKAWREEHRLSLQAVADMAEVSKQSVWSWEKGSHPKMDSAQRVIDGLELTVREFFGPTPSESNQAWEYLRNAQHD